MSDHLSLLLVMVERLSTTTDVYELDIIEETCDRLEREHYAA